MNRFLLCVFIFLFCFYNSIVGAVPWRGGGWNTGSRFLCDGDATIFYDYDNDAWLTNKSIISTSASCLIQGNGTDNLDIDANGQSVTLGNAVSDYVSVSDSGVMSFHGASYLLCDDDKSIVFGNDNDSKIFFETMGDYDFFGIGLKTGSASHSGYLILADNDSIVHPNALPSAYTSTPTLRFLSPNIDESSDYYAELFASVYGTFNIKGGYLNNVNFRNIGHDTVSLNLSSVSGDNLSIKTDAQKSQTLIGVNSTVNKTVIITDYANRIKDHNTYSSTNPIFSVQSALDPESDSDSNGVNDYTKRLSISHNSINSVIESGEGDIEIKYAGALRFVMDNDGMVVYIKNANTSKNSNGNWRCGIDPDNDARFVFQKYDHGVWNDIMELP